MKIFMQRFILILILLPFFGKAQTVNPIVEKTKNMK
ncbi:MAG: hypothetical protein ACI9CZ_001021, partial [Flavobacterium sp.]